MDGEALEALRYFSDATHPQSFVTLAGRGPVLVSAPHAVLQTRSGRLKAAERYTGMLCLMLNRRHDVPGIYKARHLMDDANHDPSSPYRNEVCRLIREGGIRCVLDLHQLRPDRSMALCIGTGRGRHVRRTWCVARSCAGDFRPSRWTIPFRRRRIPFPPRRPEWGRWQCSWRSTARF